MMLEFGSEPGGRWFKSLAPTILFRINDLYHTGVKRKCESAWSKTKGPCLMPVGHERSLFLELIALQRKVRFTANPIVGELGTRSVVWGEKPKSSSNSVPCQDAILRLEQHLPASRQTGNSGEPVKPGIKAQDSLNSMLLHDRQMCRITS